MTSGAQVVVLGALNVDLVVTCERLPGPGETVVGSDLARHGGGKGANAAVAAARAGASVRFVGAVGDDEAGTSALADLRAEGIDTDAVTVVAGVRTGTALVMVDAAGENLIAVSPGANAHLGVPLVQAALAGALPTARCLLISTEIPVATVSAAVRLAVRAGVRCVLNPAPVDAGFLDAVGAGVVLTPNGGELEDLASLLLPPEQKSFPGDERDEVAERALAVARATSAEVVVTLGRDGALLTGAGPDVHRVPPLVVPTVDATGAGDTFNGVLAARLAEGDALRDAVTLATAAASLSVRRSGARAGMPTLAEVRASGGAPVVPGEV